MKKLIYIAAVVVAFFAPAVITIIAETPPAPPPSTPAPAVAAMKLPPQTQSALVAGQIIQQVTTLLNQVIQVIDNGVPAQGETPGISAKDLQAALGTENVMRFRSAAAILSGGSAPAASPEPAK